MLVLIAAWLPLARPPSRSTPTSCVSCAHSCRASRRSRCRERTPAMAAQSQATSSRTSQGGVR
eukprot:scaffold602_cov342-Prasinococcus_capsulatus_cf.AAC.11